MILLKYFRAPKEDGKHQKASIKTAAEQHTLS